MTTSRFPPSRPRAARRAAAPWIVLLTLALGPGGVAAGRAQSATPAVPAPAPGAATEAASIYDEEPATLAPHPIPDRIEGFNRGVFKFNDGFYDVVLRPIARGYTAVTPRIVRRGLGNFFHNLEFPTRFVGNVLEGHPSGAAVEFGRFFVNTVSSLGFVATADQYPDLRERPSDLGLAFARWGIGHGSYLVIPLLGPSSIRDGIGLGLADYFLDPLHYLKPWEANYGATALLIVNESPDQLRAYDQLKAAAIDPYVALRDAYASDRANHGGNELGSTLAPVRPPAATAPPARDAGH